MATGGDYGALAARLRATEDAMRAEDEALIGMAGDVGLAKSTAGAIHAEVDAQNSLLDDLEAGMGRASSATVSATVRAAHLESDPYSWKNFCTLLGPVVLLLVIILFWVRHLIVG